MRESIYCGPAPVPSTLWSSWNLDLLLIIALSALAVGIVATHREGRSRAALAGAIVALSVAFISPLCALSSALFSARVAHHVILISVATPLLALAAPNWRVPLRLPLTLIATAQAAIIWFWHAPVPYAWALSGTAPYWVMELTLLAVAFWFWSEILSPAARPGPTLGVLLGTVVQMGLLGAILTFARTPLYDVHAGVTTMFGLTQLEDQQLAGLIMWVPAAIPYLLIAGIIVARLLPGEQGDMRARDA